MARQLAIAAVERTRDQLWMSFRVDDLRFTTTYWYADVDLLELEDRFGASLLEKLYFHIAAFEASKLCSLRPEVLDLGPLAHLHTTRFEHVWRTVFRKVWAEWRYRNDLPGYEGPELASRPVADAPAAARLEPGEVEVLAFCGGGKDSLVALKLLERAGIPYASYAYASSVYGRAEPQHALIDRMLDRCAPVRRHRHWVYDDFLDSPVLAVRDWGGLQGLTAAETPASLFGVLPVLLQHGYRYAALAHEASANAGNVTWPATGEEVNHQWGKTLEAEVLLDQYVRDELIADAGYFSVLQPIHDPVIFYLLNRDLGDVEVTHSCNVAKPWCGRCAKCAYVWLGYMAYLPHVRAKKLFPDNLLDVDDDLPWFRQMLGLEAHTPFECVGQIDEARLAFELCRHKGLRGRAMDVYLAEVPPLDAGAAKQRYLRVNTGLRTIPPHLAAALLPQMEEAARLAGEYIDRVLSQ